MIGDEATVAWFDGFAREMGVDRGPQLVRRAWDLVRDDLGGEPQFLSTHVLLVRHRDERRTIERSVEAFVSALRDVRKQQRADAELEGNIERFGRGMEMFKQAIKTGRGPEP